MKKKTYNPLVSVVMPVYNTEKYVGEAIHSILDQSFTDFEFIIIDDGSTDETRNIIQEFAKKDERIKAYKQTNQGVVKTRINLINKMNQNSKYMAIIDADDITEPQRLEKQIEIMEKNQKCAVLGSDIKIINANSQIIGKRTYPHSFKSVKNSIFQKSPIAQPVAMIRKSAGEKVGRYNKDFERCQDYELRCRFFDQGYEIINIPEPLLKYRVFDEQGKNKHFRLTLKNTIKIQKKYIFQKKYFTIKNLLYFVAELILFIIPKKITLTIFKKLTYKKI